MALAAFVLISFSLLQSIVCLFFFYVVLRGYGGPLSTISNSNLLNCAAPCCIDAIHFQFKADFKALLILQTLKFQIEKFTNAVCYLQLSLYPIGLLASTFCLFAEYT